MNSQAAYPHPSHSTSSEGIGYDPVTRLQRHAEQLNPAIRRAMDVIAPVAINTDMLQVLDVFRSQQQEHFFPVLDSEGRPLGLIRERSLKSYVYSRFGMALLANRGQSRQLEQFLSDCPTASIEASIDQVLEAAHAVPGAEGVLIAADGCYVGFIRASALVEMAHEQQLEIVRRHNAELDQKSREIQAVLQNMRQGICTILPDLTLHADFSAHLSSILENGQLAGTPLRDALFSHSDLGPDALEQIHAALMAILGQDDFMFDCNAHLLPTELRVTLLDRQRILELHWNPMLDEQDQVSRLMLVVRDITQMRELQQQAEQQRQQLQLLGEILGAGESRFTSFMQASDEQLATCRQLLDDSRHADLDDAVLAVLYRHLHTIKGNARTLGLMAVTDNLHAMEQLLQTSRDAGTAMDIPALQQALQQVLDDLGQYRMLYTARLQDFGHNPATTGTSANLLQQLQQLADQRQDSKLQSLLQQAHNTPINNLLESLAGSLPRLAEELGKPTPGFSIAEELTTCSLSPAQGQRLNDALVHILRNCMDHGIESAEQRIAAGKPPAGCIEVTGGSYGQGIQLHIGDDGRGLALQRLHGKAMEAGLLSADANDDEIAEVMFHSGLSTAGQVSMISGRGVGMDAVRSSLTDIGGSIEVAWTGPRNDTGYRPFSLILRLPAGN